MIRAVVPTLLLALGLTVATASTRAAGQIAPSAFCGLRGVRPWIAVSDPTVNAEQRFPLIAVVSVTGKLGIGALYPVLAPGASGLVKESSALLDHLRAIDKRRIRRIFGRVSANELAAIDQGLELFLGLGAKG